MTILDLLVLQLDQAYDKQSWHGPTLKGSLRGIHAEEAAWRPSPGRHGIADLVLHTAYWKYCVLRRLTGGDRGDFPRTGSNWLSLPQPYSAQQWTEDRRLLDQMHRRLRQAIHQLPPSALDLTPKGSKVSNLRLICGIIAHDLYHAGQIQYIKALRRKAGT